MSDETPGWTLGAPQLQARIDASPENTTDRRLTITVTIDIAPIAEPRDFRAVSLVEQEALRVSLEPWTLGDDPGNGSVRVPNVVGAYDRHSEAAITAAGLVPFHHPAITLTGQLVATEQSPAAGTWVPLGSEVQVWYVEGPASPKDHTDVERHVLYERQIPLYVDIDFGLDKKDWT